MSPAERRLQKYYVTCGFYPRNSRANRVRLHAIGYSRCINELEVGEDNTKVAGKSKGQV